MMLRQNEIVYLPFWGSSYAQDTFRTWLDVNRKSLQNFRVSSSIYSGAKMNDNFIGLQLPNYAAGVYDYGIGWDPITKNITVLVCYAYGATRRMGKASLSE